MIPNGPAQPGPFALCAEARMRPEPRPAWTPTPVVGASRAARRGRGRVVRSRDSLGERAQRPRERLRCFERRELATAVQNAALDPLRARSLQAVYVYVRRAAVGVSAQVEQRDFDLLALPV